ncbi:hypothetical protein Cni_G12490 [Canna indica]|uniref:AT3G52170-like helix-turn-helix domain-containing protein n=1 Tax=Canna indica TaxID=4628 RepID=A0AAQ3K9W9_9LILI|nr:hypothetical protein Cni_G12490 [Canna indica]
MQGLSTSCVQQRFALIRCCDSNDKKSRRRKTREERRTMVESFINKYRISNSGKFPSLNLTHKEVGGSFYIVREIVRDIIQENRVLGPGSPSMKALTLEDCLDEYETENIPTSPQNEMLESCIGLAVDVKQIEVSTRVYTGKNTDASVKSDKVEIVSCNEDNDANFLHVIQPEPSYIQQNTSGAEDPESLVTIESQEMAMRTSSLQPEISGEISPEVQGDLGRCNDHEVAAPKPLDEALSKEGLVLNKDVEGNCISLNEADKVSTDNSELYKTTGTGYLPEEKGFVSSCPTSDHLLNNQISFEEEFPSLISSATKPDSELTCLRMDDLIEPSEGLVLNKDVEGNCISLSEADKVSTDNTEMYKTTGTGYLPEEKGFVSPCPKSDHLLNNLISFEEEFPSLISSATKPDSELTCLRMDDLIEPHAPLAIPDLPNEQGESSTQIQIDTSSILNETEQIENSILGDEEPKSISSVSQSSFSPASSISCSEAPPATQIHIVESTTPKTEHSSTVSLTSSAEEISATQPKDQKDDGSSAGKGSCCSSSSANAKEKIKSETNPVWNAIRTFVTAFFKFWSE